ncbi:hypothetical protein BDR06DRAFT_957418 [Suillus hirtellus]|nr:hypothetical protein BDR06DRAFT_957418 [Suillus hirtellus]
MSDFNYEHAQVACHCLLPIASTGSYSRHTRTGRGLEPPLNSIASLSEQMDRCNGLLHPSKLCPIAWTMTPSNYLNTA